jgi:NADH dehydrogenase
VNVLVAGGTGRLGTLLVERLRGQGVAMRVLTRDPERAAHLNGLGVEVVQGDVRRPESLGPAVVGVDTVVSAVQGFAGPGRVSPRSVDEQGNGNLVAAAAGAGAEVVLLSVVGASADNALELLRCKHAAEQRLQASGAPWTIVRATAFVELWADLLSKGVVFGRGDNPINFVSVRDVAQTVERAVLDPSLRGQVLEVTGEDLTFNELAALLARTRGTPERFRHVPRWLLRTMAPLHRQPRAALVMDTQPMTAQPRPGSAPATPLAAALASPAS